MAEEIVATGGFISDDIMLKVVTSRLDLVQNRVCVSRATSKSRLTRAVALATRRFSTNTGPREDVGRSSAVRRRPPHIGSVT